MNGGRRGIISSLETIATSAELWPQRDDLLFVKDNPHCEVFSFWHSTIAFVRFSYSSNRSEKSVREMLMDTHRAGSSS